MSYDNPEWLERARPIDGMLFDTFFLLREKLYIGPDRITDVSEYDAPRNNVRLTLPSIPRLTADRISSTEATGSEEALAAYYVGLIEASRQHRSKDPDSSYFWLRPHARNSQSEAEMTFPWYDTLTEIQSLADAVSSLEDGFLINDIDQGWDFEVIGRGDRLFIRTGDGEGQTYDTFAIPREPFRADVKAAVERTHDLVARLTKIVGRDYWTAWRYDSEHGLIPSSS